MHHFYEHYQDLFQFMKQGKLNPWLDTLIPQMEQKLIHQPHGDIKRWLDAYTTLPDIKVDQVRLDQSHVEVSSEDSLEAAQQDALQHALRQLMPWRKGPFRLFDTTIDTEWRSDMKWDRIAPHIDDLTNRLVLDVGCGSGYHCWRMLGAGANRVIGIDPGILFLFQFLAIKQYCGPTAPIHLLPLKMEDVPPNLGVFDTVFSMGVLYHRRGPLDHLMELKGALRDGGQLVLETLVVEGPEGYSLVPKDRYAMMRNVWFIPSCDTLHSWLQRCGFKHIRCIEKNRTTIEEQRPTDWMGFNSLKDFLDPQNPDLTVEGYPAPTRATFVAYA